MISLGGFIFIFVGLGMGWMLWAVDWDGDDHRSSYLVYEWTKHGGSVAIASYSDFGSALDRVDAEFDRNNRNAMADNWNSVKSYFVVYCHDYCEVVA